MVDKDSIWGLRRKAYAPLELKGIRISEADLVRFMGSVAPADDRACWDWGGTINGSGYGILYLVGSGRPRTQVLAHRLSWMLANKKNIPDAQMMRHDCDNPKCVNPHHLRPGTAKDNAGDAKSRGRLKGTRHSKAKGEDSGRSKLTEDAVRSIRERYAAGGVTQKELGAEYGVTKSTICGVLNGRVWGHLA